MRVCVRACFSFFLCVCVREREKRETRLPQQLCHYVGGNYESDENGEGERAGAKALTLERERNCQLDPDLHWQIQDVFL